VLNTVGAIRSLIPRDPKRASDLLYDFSKYMRTKLEQKDFFRPIPFQEELEHIRIYLKLEQARFGDTVEVNYDIRDSAFYVLPLTIQPFVENAIKHGLFHNEGGGVLTISCYEEGDGHVVEIVDNGVGFDAENLSALLENKSSVGLRSALLRLENEMQATVSIRSHVGSNKGTQVRIVIPESR
jgi:sensor histidine kinase YesM